MHSGTATATVDPSLFLINVAIILIFTKVGGMLSKRAGMPSVVGQVMTGIILGPSILGLLKPDIFINEVGQLGVIFLMFLAGLDTDIREMKAVGKVSLLTALGGVLLPLAGGIWLVWLLKHNFQEALFTGTILTATSVSITVQALLELGKLKSKEGNCILAAAVIDDIIGILLLAFVVKTGRETGAGILRLAGLITAFFACIFVFGRFIFPRMINLYAKYDIREGRVTLAVACCLFFAWLAEHMGVATIIGAYAMGIFIGRTRIKKLVTERIQVMAYSFFIPIFFVGIGAAADLHRLGRHSILFVAALLIVAITAKLLGSMGGALLGGFSFRSALRTGIGMISRGEVALIIAALGLQKGFIDNDIFSATLLLVITSSLATPLLLSVAFKEPAKITVQRTGNNPCG